MTVYLCRPPHLPHPGHVLYMVGSCRCSCCPTLPSLLLLHGCPSLPASLLSLLPHPCRLPLLPNPSPLPSLSFSCSPSLPVPSLFLSSCRPSSCPVVFLLVLFTLPLPAVPFTFPCLLHLSVIPRFPFAPLLCLFLSVLFSLLHSFYTLQFHTSVFLSFCHSPDVFSSFTYLLPSRPCWTFLVL